MNLVGIQPPHITFYRECIRFHSEAAMTAIDYLASFIEMTNETKGHYDMTNELSNRIFDNLQSILIHSATLSRYFWPSKSGKNGLHEARGQQLRGFFGLIDESPLKSRKLRNQLEHFDENLDKYLSEKSITGYILPSYVGGKLEDDGVPTHLFRAFYIDTGIFEVLGVEYEIQPIIDELCKIYFQFKGNENT